MLLNCTRKDVNLESDIVDVANQHKSCTMDATLIETNFYHPHDNCEFTDVNKNEISSVQSKSDCFKNRINQTNCGDDVMVTIHDQFNHCSIQNCNANTEENCDDWIQTNDDFHMGFGYSSQLDNDQQVLGSTNDPVENVHMGMDRHSPTVISNSMNLHETEPTKTAHSCLCCPFQSKTQTCKLCSWILKNLTRIHKPRWCLWCPKFHHRRLPNENMLILSVIQLLCGFAAIILSMAAFIKTIFLYRIATGFWAGLLMLITGFHGLVAARRPILCMLIGLLTLCMLVSLAACVLICVSVAGAIEDGIMSKTTDLNTNYWKRLESIILSGKNSTSFGKRPGTYKLHVSKQWDSNLRMCQMILHILLLMVGILEASVSLATSILCFRCVCSNSPNYRFHNPRSSRTNIISFNAQTANHAVSVLRSGTMNHFAGPGNLYLAFDSDPPESSTTVNRRKPQIHHTLMPFLPNLDHALILTQAGSGSAAMTAARAAANLVRPRSLDQPELKAASPELPNIENVNNRLFNRIRNRFKRVNVNKKPRLLYTSFHIPQNRPNPSSNAPLSTMVYVIPSPIRDEPPTIFPPFPPSYNDNAKNISSKNPAVSNNSTPISPSRRFALRRRLRQRSRRNNALNPRLLRTFFTQFFFGQSENARSRTHLHSNRPVASAPISAGDRLIQPVLIIGDYPMDRNNSPPKYLPPGESDNTNNQEGQM